MLALLFVTQDYDDNGASQGLVELRPMDVGDILDGTIRVYRRRPWVFIGILAIVVGLPMFIQQTVGQYFTSVIWEIIKVIDQGPEAIRAFLSEDFILAVTATGAVELIMFFVAPLAQAAMVYVVSETILDREVGIMSSIKTVLPKAGKIILAYLLYVIIVLVFFIPFFAFIMILPMTPDRAFLVIGFLVTFLFCFMFIVYFMIKYMFIPHAVVLDDVGVVGSLRRSFNLTGGYWWRTFGIYILIWLMVSIIVYMLSQTVTLANMGLRAIPGMTDFVRFVIGGVITTIMSLLINPITSIATTLMYYDLRVRKEGFDLLLLAASVAGDEREVTDTSGEIPLG